MDNTKFIEARYSVQYVYLATNYSKHHYSMETASVTNVSNFSDATVPNDALKHSYVVSLKVSLPPLLNDQPQHVDADDDFTPQSAQLKCQRRQ